MRTYFYCALLVLTSSCLDAQDTLYFMDASKQIVKILEVNTTQVKYKPNTAPDGPTYVINKDDVLKIMYETGRIDTFAKSPMYNKTSFRKEDPRVTDFGRNFISINVFDLFQGSLTLGYEYIFKSGLYGIKVPISFRIANGGSSSETKVFGTGMDFNFYPDGQGRIRLFFGPSFQYRKFDLTYYASDTESAYSLLFQAGLLFQPQKHFNISLDLGLGYARFISSGYLSNYGEVATKAGLNIGYKF